MSISSNLPYMEYEEVVRDPDGGGGEGRGKVTAAPLLY